MTLDAFRAIGDECEQPFVGNAKRTLLADETIAAYLNRFASSVFVKPVFGADFGRPERN